MLLKQQMPRNIAGLDQPILATVGKLKIKIQCLRATVISSVFIVYKLSYESM
jgi:hypothetical protein